MEQRLADWRRQGFELAKEQPHMTLRSACDLAGEIAYELSDEIKGGSGDG